MRTAHRIIAWLFIAVFVATGVAMKIVLPPPDADGDLARRMMYRSAHIYILFGALLNLLVGSLARPAASLRGRRWQALASACLLACPILFLLAFALEPALMQRILGATAASRLLRPLAAAGVALALLGTIPHALAARGRHGAIVPTAEPGADAVS
jgi:hypothetical protein